VDFVLSDQLGGDVTDILCLQRIGDCDCNFDAHKMETKSNSWSALKT
jgi:hypothetical protein